MERALISFIGANVVVLGRSDIVGNPVAAMLRRKDATVTQCHSRTPQAVMIAAVSVANPSRASFYTRLCFNASNISPVYSSRMLMLSSLLLVNQNMSKENGLNLELSLLMSERTIFLVCASHFISLYSTLSSFLSDDTKKTGQRLVGDVNFATASTVAAHITPVPGGVGPMTVAMLISNTLKSAERMWEKERGRKLVPLKLNVLEKVPR